MRRWRAGWKHVTRFGFPLVVLAAIKAGFYGGGIEGRRNEILLNRLLAKPTVGINNFWIAALALEHDLILITRDKHFQRIPQLLRA
jgi:hypothetical protein